MAGSLSLRSLFDGNGIKAAPRHLSELFEFTARDGPENHFASWLPYVAYAPDDKIFVNRDTLGFMVELMPQSGADERMVEILLSLYATCPKGTGIQFSLFASPHLIEPLSRYGNLRVEDADHADKARDRGRPARNSNLYRTLARRRVAHYLRGSHVSLTQGYHFTFATPSR
jgi:conjugal transfer ATP-binding protein TraC